MSIQKYDELLKRFPDTLKNVSYDSKNSEHMTENIKQIVNFDNYAKNITSKEHLRPKSCDALFFYEQEEKWYLIEFKNGILKDKCPNCKLCKKCEPQKEMQEIKEKVFSSLLLLTEVLKNDIKYFKEKMTFILVYNKEKNPIYSISDHLKNFSKKLENIFLNKSSCMNNESFNETFVKKYC